MKKRTNYLLAHFFFRARRTHIFMGEVFLCVCRASAKTGFVNRESNIPQQQPRNSVQKELQQKRDNAEMDEGIEEQNRKNE